MRGGARPGSGRKKLSESEKKKEIKICIDREVYAYLEKIKNKSAYINELIKKNMEK